MEKYRRLRVLGQGACSTVFLVQDTETGENLAVKQIEASMSEQERERALREAALLRVMKHPGIVGYREAFITRSGAICLIMEYADGGDLHQLIQQQRYRAIEAIEEAQVLRWLFQLCSALRYLHERGIIHRDIKARNIFLRHGRCEAPLRVQLGDFGISTVLDGPTGDSASAPVGTPCYASPERILRQPYGASADIWSLGVVVYEMCALRRPFNATSIEELVQSIVVGEYEPLEVDGQSEELRLLVARMMAPDPNDRPTAAEILGMPLLQSAAGGFPPQGDWVESPQSGLETLVATTPSTATHRDDGRAAFRPGSTPSGLETMVLRADADRGDEAAGGDEVQVVLPEGCRPDSTPSLRETLVLRHPPQTSADRPESTPSGVETLVLRLEPGRAAPSCATGGDERPQSTPSGLETLVLRAPERATSPPAGNWRSAGHPAGRVPDGPDPQVPELQLPEDRILANDTQAEQPGSPKEAWLCAAEPGGQPLPPEARGGSRECGSCSPTQELQSQCTGTLDGQKEVQRQGLGHTLLHGAKRLFGRP